MEFDLSKGHFGPAAGMVKSVTDVEGAVRSVATVIPVGSITEEALVGNTGQNEVGSDDDWAYLNALGLPNVGLDGYTEMLPHMMRIAAEAGKLLLPSVAGFSVMQYVNVTTALYSLGFRASKLNLGCPNARDDAGNVKPIASFDVGLICSIVGGCAEIAPSGSRLYLKMSPYSNPLELGTIAQTIVQLACRYPRVKLILVTPNTFPNCMAFDQDGRPAINAKTATGAPVTMGGGSGGDLFRSIGVGQVRQFVNAFAAHKASIDVIGAGGISTAAHAKEYLAAGAVGFEVGSAYRRHGPRILGEIAMGF